VELDHQYIYDFLQRFPETKTIIVNGGDPLMMDPEYYWKIIDHLDSINSEATLSFTTNLYPFYKNPQKWAQLFINPRVGVTTSFQYGGGRLKGDLTEYTEEDFWKVSDTFLKYIGYRPDFISVITKENEHDAIKNVELAKKMDVECKLNYAMSSGPPVKFKGIIMGQEGKPYLLANIYEIYREIWKRGLAPWEFNTKQMMKRLKGGNTTCPQNRECDAGIRALQPSGDYYSCGSFGDDRVYPIDFKAEMSGATIRPLKHEFELQTMTENCYGCPMFDVCNGCRKTIKDHKDYGLTEIHCSKMKTLAADIIASNDSVD
jgi:radical SAM protein with 4Fe4S-binding SPASM domain